MTKRGLSPSLAGLFVVFLNEFMKQSLNHRVHCHVNLRCKWTVTAFPGKQTKKCILWQVVLIVKFVIRQDN